MIDGGHLVFDDLRPGRAERYLEQTEREMEMYDAEESKSPWRWYR